MAGHPQRALTLAASSQGTLLACRNLQASVAGKRTSERRPERFRWSDFFDDVERSALPISPPTRHRVLRGRQRTIDLTPSRTPRRRPYSLGKAALAVAAVVTVGALSSLLLPRPDVTWGSEDVVFANSSHVELPFSPPGFTLSRLTLFASGEELKWTEAAASIPLPAEAIASLERAAEPQSQLPAPEPSAAPRLLEPSPEPAAQATEHAIADNKPQTTPPTAAPPRPAVVRAVPPRDQKNAPPRKKPAGQQVAQPAGKTPDPARPKGTTTQVVKQSAPSPVAQSPAQASTAAPFLPFASLFSGSGSSSGQSSVGLAP